MDPKTPANLDPKLKEVYERVMGTPTSPTPTDEQSPTTPMPPIPSQLPKEQEPPQTESIQSVRAEPVPVEEPVPTHPFPKTSFVAGNEKTSSNMLPLIIVGLIIFFAAYTVFWLKFFNIPLIPLPF